MPDELSDDDIDRLLAASSPYDAAADTRLDARAAAVLATILAPRPRRRRRLALTISAPVLAAAVTALLIVLIVNPFAATAPAAAMPLRPLTFEASTLTLSEELTSAQRQLAVSDGPDEPVRQAVTVAWYAHVQMDGPDAGAVVSPEVETWTWNEDYSAHLRVTAGRAYTLAEDGSQLPVRDDLSPEGTVLRDDDFAASDVIFDGEPFPWLKAGDSADFYRQLLDEAYRQAGEDPTAALRVVADLQGAWTLTNAQQSHILEALRAYPQLELLGSTRDREGRDAFAVGAVTNPGLHQLVLLISPETGRILATETTYLGDDPEVPMQPNTVMSYELWDTVRP